MLKRAFRRGAKAQLSHPNVDGQKKETGRTERVINGRTAQVEATLMKGMIGKKVGMTQVFDEQGTVIPVTVIQAGPCYVTQVRNVDRDGYVSVQLGFGETKPKNLTKGQLGHLQRSDLPALRHLREFRLVG